jgi:hypothetical protein
MLNPQCAAECATQEQLAVNSQPSAPGDAFRARQQFKSQQLNQASKTTELFSYHATSSTPALPVDNDV